ncbi:MAG: COX15/CtaA family protein, partial [Planctomycetota bacterium]
MTTLLAQDAAAVTPASNPLGLGVLLALFVVGGAVTLAWARWVRPMNLAIGFATTVAMWTLSFIAMLQPGQAVGEVLFAGAVACVLAGGFVAGRMAPGAANGLSVGLVSATVNLLVIGAFLRDEQGGGGLSRPAMYVLGLFAVSALLGLVGDAIGRARTSMRRLPAAPTLMGIVAVANILVMIVIGGLVTGYEAGLAVPDWPNSFGHNMLLYPVSQMKGGVYYEHAHRLFGMLVGLTAFTLAAICWRHESRRWVKVLATALLLAVCVQGLMGGLRVTGTLTLAQDRSLLAPSTLIAIAHGVFGQLVFATTALIAAATSAAWLAAPAPLVA